MKKFFQFLMILCVIATYLPIETGTTSLAYAEDAPQPEGGDGTPAPPDEDAEPECD